MRRVRTVLALLLCLLAGTAAAQVPELDLPRGLPVTLVADEVLYDTVGERLTARGSVQVFYGDRTLTADEIVYDARARKITASGRLVLRNPDGATVYADYAELDPDLRDGLVRSARAMLLGRFRLASVEAQRVGGRYNVLGKAVFSNCDVCLENPVPLWQIRARRVVHDELARQIHYEDATFDVAGRPVFYLPYFRHPDPTLERASGFLVPSVLTSEIFGYGLKLPYHWVIDESSDATFTPFLTSQEGLILEGEYRRRFEAGYLELLGSVKYENELAGRVFRGDIGGRGHYFLTDTIFARFEGRVASDDGYLTEFEYSNADRLVTDASVASFRERGWWELGVAYFQSLRESTCDPARPFACERVGRIPIALPEFDLREVRDEALFGGRLGLTANSVALTRRDGQDSARATVAVDWSRDWTTDAGLLLSGSAELRFDLFRTEDSADPALVPDGTETRLTPTLALGARWPFARQDARAMHILEPVAQFVWSEPSSDQIDLPNEDSLLVELDETNLFDVSRFPGFDRIEPGPRVNLGLRYQRIDAEGWNLGFVAGRILRPEVEPVFAGVPWLADNLSDYVGAVTLSLPPHAKVVNRVLLRDDFTLDRNELRFDLAWGPAELSGSYIYLSGDILGEAIENREEAGLQGLYRLTPNWRVGAGLVYDLQSGRFVRAGGQLTYGNECIEVDFSVSRRFTSFSNVNASTSFGLQVRLAGLGSSLSESERAGRCQRLVR